MTHFWFDTSIWTRASRNTSFCLLGCSIGDLGTIFAFQMLWPEAPVLPVMILAIIMGLVTSFALEIGVLYIAEKMTLKKSIEVAFKMAVMSMIAMEIAMNVTDYYLTGGARITLWALPIILLVGFLIPLPYNYWKLKAHDKACH